MKNARQKWLWIFTSFIAFAGGAFAETFSSNFEDGQMGAWTVTEDGQLSIKKDLSDNAYLHITEPTFATAGSLVVPSAFVKGLGINGYIRYSLVSIKEAGLLCGTTEINIISSDGGRAKYQFLTSPSPSNWTTYEVKFSNPGWAIVPGTTSTTMEDILANASSIEIVMDTFGIGYQAGFDNFTMGTNSLAGFASMKALVGNPAVPPAPHTVVLIKDPPLAPPRPNEESSGGCFLR